MLFEVLAGTRFVADPSVNYVATLPGEAGIVWAFVAEVLISFGLMLTVLHVSNNKRLNRYTAYFAGSLVAIYITFEAPLSGMSMNPARSLGSALPGGIWDGLWIYFIAPPIGMLAAAQVYLRRHGVARVYCCKLHHENGKRCIFRCRYDQCGAVESGGDGGYRAAAVSDMIRGSPPIASTETKMNRERDTSGAQSERLARYADAWARCVAVLERPMGALVDLLIRLILAQIFFTSAVLKLADWNNALYLAANEYPVSWLDPVTAAWLGVAVEFLGSLLLACGLGTRLAAMALLGLTVVIQVEYRALDSRCSGRCCSAGTSCAVPVRFRSIAAWRGGSPIARCPWRRRFCACSQVCANSAIRCFRLLLRIWIGATMTLGALRIAPVGWDTLLPLDSAAQFHGAPAVVVRRSAVDRAGNPRCGVRLHRDWPRRFDGRCGNRAALVVAGAGGACGAWRRRLVLRWCAGAILRRRFPQLAGEPAFSLEDVPQVVIVGAGFGGLACAAQLARARVAVTLIDRRNYHLFQPLLYQVATASLSPGDIATPVRGLFREHFNVRVLLGEVTGVDREGAR